MELRKLRYFARVAQDGSLTRSAGVLRVAQPALSRQMRLLEEELGLKLFARTPRGMQLTEEGAELHASIAAPLRELELALDNARTASKLPVGNLVIGLPPGLSELLALPLTEMMDSSFPGLVIRLVEGPTGSLVDWLNRGAVDVALLEETSRDSRLEDRIVGQQPLWLVGPPSAGLRPDTSVSLETIAQRPLIIPSHHVGIRGSIDDATAQSSLPLNVRTYADSPLSIRTLVAAGKGNGILPEAYCRAAIAEGRLCGAPIEDDRMAISIQLTRRRRGRVSQDRLTTIEDAIVDVTVRNLSRDAGEAFVHRTAGGSGSFAPVDDVRAADTG